MKNILHTCIVVLALALPSGLSAQYSNASLNGPWITHVGSNYTYIIFDGNGNISALGSANDSLFPAGNYTVLANGSFTGSITLTNGTQAITGNMTSDSTATFNLNAQGPFTEFRVDNAGLLADTLTGTIYDSTSMTTKNIKVTVSSSGLVAFAGGDIAGLSGKIFAQAGIFAGYITSTDPTCVWQNIQVQGTYAANTLQGTIQFGNSRGTCNSTGTVALTRTSSGPNAITTIAARVFSVGPNPFTDHLLLTTDASGSVQVDLYDLIGAKILTRTYTTDLHNIQLTGLSGLSDGIYLLNIIAGGQTITKRLTKN